MNNKDYLYVDKPNLFDSADELAKFTGCLEITHKRPEINDLYLELNQTGLAVISKDFKPLYLAEIYTKLGFRQLKLSNELLIQTIKLNTKSGAIVWDLTAGLGKDAFILASFGYIVTMVEQHPILATILHYALNNKIIPSKNLNLVFGNSIEFLSNATTSPDIIYLDPMFKDNKNAKAKKDMQIIQSLVSDEVTNYQDLFTKSYAIVKNKIIIKRDNKQENIVESPNPSYVKSGKTIRFDVYQKN